MCTIPSALIVTIKKIDHGTIHKTAGIKMLTPQQAVLLMNKEQALVIDIRDSKAYTDGHIVGAINTTLQEFEQKLKRYTKYKNKPILVYCNAGQQIGKFAAGLKKLGFNQIHGLKGGTQAWVNANLPLHK